MSTALPSQEIGPTLGQEARFNALAGKLRSISSAGLPEDKESLERQRAELRNAAQDFEALFLHILIREMRPDQEGGLFGENLGGDIYQDMFDAELAKVMSKTGQLGLAEMIEKQVASLLGFEYEDDSIPGETLSGRIAAPVRRAAANAYEAVEKTVKQAIDSLLKPIEGDLSSGYGPRVDPFDGEHSFHKGIDIAAPGGSPIKAAADGKVVFSGSMPGYGNTVILEHAGGYETRYAHNDNNLVRKGEEVDAGQVVASVGDSGRSTGPHLHFEVRKDGVPIDPFSLLR